MKVHVCVEEMCMSGTLLCHIGMELDDYYMKDKGHGSKEKRMSAY